MIARDCRGFLTGRFFSTILDHKIGPLYLPFAHYCLPVLTRSLPKVTRMKLTKRAIAAIVHNPSRDIYIWDEEVRGFGLRVKPTGVRSFIVQYRNSSGI